MKKRIVAGLLIGCGLLLLIKPVEATEKNKRIELPNTVEEENPEDAGFYRGLELESFLAHAKKKATQDHSYTVRALYKTNPLALYDDELLTVSVERTDEYNGVKLIKESFAEKELTGEYDTNNQLIMNSLAVKELNDYKPLVYAVPLKEKKEFRAKLPLETVVVYNDSMKDGEERVISKGQQALVLFQLNDNDTKAVLNRSGIIRQGYPRIIMKSLSDKQKEAIRHEELKTFIKKAVEQAEKDYDQAKQNKQRVRTLPKTVVDNG